MTYTTLNLYHGGLQKVKEVESLESALAKYEITYHESVGDVSPSTSIPNLFTSQSDISVDPYTSATDPSSSWMSWGGGLDSSTSAPNPFISWGDFQMQLDYIV